MSNKKDVAIIGAGLVGSLLAIYMCKRRYKVTLFERRGDMRLEKMSAGKSINLALSDRGIKALTEVGIMDEIREIAIPMHGRYLHNADGSTGFQPYGKEGQYINSVSRGELNKKLMSLAEQSGAEIRFHHKCANINWERNEITFEISKDGEIETYDHKADLIFGADGAYSAARLSHQLQHSLFQYSQYYINYGYKELLIPANDDGSFRMDQNALHIWPRGNYMLIALPNTDASFTCTFFFPFEGDPSFKTLTSDEKVTSFFKEHFADALSQMPGFLDVYNTNPTSGMVTVKCYPWVREDKFALIGDAAHAIVPFFGQGMNAGFEDCSVLNSLIDKHSENWEEILQEYQQLRKPDADAIADMAIENFTEMRDKVADPKFLLQKKIEARFSAKHPDKWLPAYSMVTFSPNIRYSEAMQRGRAQQKIMDEVMAGPGIEQTWQSDEIENFILQKLDA